LEKGNFGYNVKLELAQIVQFNRLVDFVGVEARGVPIKDLW